MREREREREEAGKEKSGAGGVDIFSPVPHVFVEVGVRNMREGKVALS